MNPSSTSTLDVPATSGGFVVREVVRFTFFIRRPHKDIAEAVVQAIARVVDLLPPPALSMFASESGDWLDFDADGLKARVLERLAGKEKPVNGNASLSGNQANLPDFALDYAGLALDRPVFRDGSCMLTFFIAASAFGPYMQSSEKLAERLAIDLDCQSAYVDVALIGDQTRRQAMARRYHGVDISDPRRVARDIEDRLPGIFWKNFLNSSLVSALGGRSTLQAALSANARIQDDSRGGVILTLGPAPTRGDVNRSESVDDRRALARLAHGLGLLHVPRKVTYFEPDNELGKKEAQEMWHLRYVNR
jgi:hypothetical protein